MFTFSRFPYKSVDTGVDAETSAEAFADPYEFNRISETFCVLPFTHLATYTDGSALLCCVAQNDSGLNLNETSMQEAWNSPYLRTARLKMLAGEKVPACTFCYAEEKTGCRSHRVTENRVWKERFGRDFILDRVRRVQRDGRLDDSLIAIDLRLGNTCNLQCVMCRPQDSSRWTTLAQKLAAATSDPSLREEWLQKSNIDQSRFEWYTASSFWDDLDLFLPNMREIIIGGGEPMLLPEHRRLIQACVDSGAAQGIQLRYHTNGTILDPALFPLWEKFKVVELFLSIDSWGEKNSYLRYPSNWGAVDRNLRLIDRESPKTVRSMILCSVHIMNMFYLDDFSGWIRDQHFEKVTHGFNGYFHPGVVHYPAHLSVQNYPPHLKTVITKKIAAFEETSAKKSNKIPGVVNLMNAADHSNRLIQTREYIQRLDAERGTRFDRVFPELNEYLQIR